MNLKKGTEQAENNKYSRHKNATKNSFNIFA